MNFKTLVSMSLARKRCWHIFQVQLFDEEEFFINNFMHKGDSVIRNPK